MRFKRRAAQLSCIRCPHSFKDEKAGMDTMLRCGHKDQAYGWCGRVVASFRPGREALAEGVPVPAWCILYK